MNSEIVTISTNITYLKTCLDQQDKKIKILEQLISESISLNKQILVLIKEQNKFKPASSSSHELKTSIDSLTEQFSQLSTERKIVTKSKNFLTYNTEEVKKHLKL